MLNKGIPIALSLNPSLETEPVAPSSAPNKRRLLTIASLAVAVAVAISFIAKLLVYLIDLCSNIAFHGEFTTEYLSPATNNLGLWVMVVPVIGGVLVGLMALYGSKAIRGHGIPEAMEQVLTNQSRIKPTITYLKPLSAAISIGTGGPFGAEGPIIATGGALGSTLGQLLRITHNERKILLAAGATAGMSAIFGTPIAAIFLAIELLLFEFSPRSIIPVALACITGAAGHHLLFEAGPVFAIEHLIGVPSNTALAGYSAIGIAMGVLSVLVTKIVYWVEDAFEKLPIHWMWWPAIGGLGVGVIGYFAPRTLGVGYENITEILSGSMPLQIVLSLCLLKFLSWAIALGSGTSGGTLAPLLTIGAATGALLGSVILYFFPGSGVTLTLAALVGMSAMFAGASRALLTSIVFALETTMQSNALLPLLAACTGSYFVSFFLMENTIMTEKIARRGVKTPDSYEPDILEKVTVAQVIQEEGLVLSEDNSIGEVREWLDQESDYQSNYFIIASDENEFRGIVSSSNLFSHHHPVQTKIGSLIKRRNISVDARNSLRTAVELMAKENLDMLPVVSKENQVIGVLSYQNIISAYKTNMEEHEQKTPNISLKRKSLKILLRGQRLMNTGKKQEA
ncbi:chloride channel protein [Rufibacter radiotolerans]|uniref:Chloride channel protein n=1 Tax=Rufibacter radiotolerans TaxID=1379910 RepID=A0A0H4VKL1_9BACT|nr:chloride channel protein [Rufibacter radiotolerans]AKQ44422.1 chloride channel protein [Rufibacter radiotolerans]